MKVICLKYLLTIIIAVVNGFFAVAQTSYHITTSQGLATHQLTVLIKDRQNNMWFGSYNGLHKHEGTSIKVYGKSGKDSASLSSKEIHPVFEDKRGFIWAGTTGGLDKLDPVTGTILHYTVRSEERNDNNIGYVYSIFQDAEENIWLTTDVGMFIVDYKTGKYRMVPGGVKTANGVPEYNMGYKGHYATQKGIWMILEGKPAFYDYKTKQFYHRYNNPERKPIFGYGDDGGPGGNTDLCVDKAGNMYFIANSSFLVKYNLKTEQTDSFRFAFPKDAWQCCYSLAADFKGNIWIGFRYGGLLLFNNANHQFTPIRYDDANSLVGSDYVYSLCEDYLERMWVTTDNGIFVINYYDSAVQQKYLSNKKEYTNINFEAGIISQDESGNIYVPYNAGGLFRYNVFGGNTRHFPVTDTGSLAYSYAFTEQKNKLLISSRGTLKEADTSSHKIILLPPEQSLYKLLSSYPRRLTWVFKKDANAIYFKKANGLLYYYNGTSKLEVIPSQGFMKQACVSKDKRYLYLLSENGDLVKRNLETLVMDTIPIVAKTQQLDFSYANTRDVADDGNGNLWITSQNGLIKYNIKTASLSIYTTADGLLHDFSFTLCSDSKNRLWVGSMGGVNLYDPQHNSFINVFPESPDKLSNYFGSSLEAKDGHIYFLFGGKLVNINPEAFFTRDVKERSLKLNEIQVNGSATHSSSKTLSNLSYNQNRIYFRFGLQEFTDPQKVQYAYRLQGLDTNWIDAGNRSDVTFNSLQPGKYTLYVKAKDVYGNEVKQQLSIPFTIHPPFWQTWWFKLLIFLLVGSSVFALVQEKIKAIKRKEAIKQQIIALQVKALRAQMNPHFIFNALNSIQQFSMQNDIDNANKYLSRFSKALRMALQQSEHSKIKLSTEIEMLELYLELEALRLGDTFSYQVVTDDELETEAVSIPSMMIQPLIENALKHGLSTKKGERTLQVTFEMINDHYLKCVVEDNGIGRQEAQKNAASIREMLPHQSMGIKLVTERLALLEDEKNSMAGFKTIDLTDENGHAAGTRVEVILPVD